MKRLTTFLLLAFIVKASAQTSGYQVGALVSDFSLKNTNNKTVALSDYPDAKGYIVAFTCNTCPVAKAYEERLIQLNSKYAPLGYPVIAINPNDPDVSAGDSFQAMQERAKSKQYAFAYLYDPGQEVTRQFGAERTPHIYLLQKTAKGNKVAYIGAIDNDPEEANPQRINYLENAIAALQKGKQPDVAFTKAVGCGVKFKK